MHFHVVATSTNQWALPANAPCGLLSQRQTPRHAMPCLAMPAVLSKRHLCGIYGVFVGVVGFFSDAILGDNLDVNALEVNW